MSHRRVSVYLFVCERSNFSIATKAIRKRICISKKIDKKLLTYCAAPIEDRPPYNTKAKFDLIQFCSQCNRLNTVQVYFCLICVASLKRCIQWNNQNTEKEQRHTHTFTWNKLILPVVLKLMEQMCRFSAVYMYNSNLHFNSTPNGCMMVC